jgi:hypothetical protein
MMHNNYIVGEELKMYRMKELGLYTLDVNGEYSNPNAKYLTVEYIGNDDQSIESDIKKLVNICNNIRRILVLPPIEIEGKFVSRPYYKLNRVLKQLKYGYRETVLNNLYIITRYSLLILRFLLTSEKLKNYNQYTASKHQIAHALLNIIANFLLNMETIL